MDCQTKIKELRESTGMNRERNSVIISGSLIVRSRTGREIADMRLDYVLRLLEYYIRMEGLMQKSMEIYEITDNKKQYLTLLLLADEQEDMIDRYLERWNHVRT